MMGLVVLVISTTRAAVDSLSSVLYSIEREIKIANRPRKKVDPWFV